MQLIIAISLLVTLVSRRMRSVKKTFNGKTTAKISTAEPGYL